ncbi:MAG TPA: hypothetical protein VK805_09420 [Candidatus Baltobacteraceae bacterium]|nr:hypothetical protein [Candidatus Baltobacteraceae bacterium]
MFGKQHGVVVYLAVLLAVTLAWAGLASAQQQTTSAPAVSPLVHILQAKGILTPEEVAQINQASSASDADQRLAKLLLSKGVISQTDYNQMMGTPAVVNASAGSSTNASMIPTVYRVPVAGAPAAAAAPSSTAVAADPDDQQQQTPPGQTPPQIAPSVSPTTLSAANPVRVFPVGGIPKGDLKPAIKLGPIGLTPYGFLKATFIHDSSSPGGDDFPLPGFLGDSGPNSAPEFHVKARSTRFGNNFEWLDPSSSVTVTGKFEMDFEGNFNRSDNRNLSSIRSYNPSIRLAYGRIDWKVNETNTLTAVMGQDWTPFGSSTLPNMLESTGLGIAFGNIYERSPQFRSGYTHDFGRFQLMPEIAVVLPAVGDTPSAANLFNQLGYGERQGPDSNTPQVEGRIVGQFKLDNAPGVAPAQLIFSFEEGHRTAIVLGAAVPTATGTCPGDVPCAKNLFQAAFPTGVRVGSDTNGWDFEWQLPTRYATLIGKFYSGSDLRYYFAGQLFSNYNATGGFTPTNLNTAGTATSVFASTPSIDGGSTVLFGLNAAGTPVVIPQLPVRAKGGFTQLGLPLSRWFGHDPEGRHSGWSLYLMYGTDQANTHDLLHTSAVASSRARSDMTVGTLNYKLNKWVSFAYEQSLYRTRANTATEINPVTGLPNYPLFEGIPQHEWRDLRSEGGVIFSF